MASTVGFLFSHAQTGIVNLASVPEEMKKGANVIVHSENITLEIDDLEDAKMKVQRIYTVLNSDGKDALFFADYNTKFMKLDDAEMKVFDQNGKQVSRHKKKDMMTVAVGEGLIEDGYMTFYRVDPLSYPVTIELNFEKKFKSTLFLPDYDFIHAKESVVQSSYTVKAPLNFKLRYQPKMCSLEPVITKDEKNATYNWKVSNLQAIQDEYGSTSANNRFPSIKIVGDQFSHFGYKGEMSSWKAFGAWINALFNGLDELPADRQQFFQQMVSSAKSNREKVRLVYQYLQDNFRYVSIQLGIGGLQPFPAKFTDSKKYGDCKGLSNYMKAALKAVGIRSHVAIINAGYNDEPVDASFPANRFNHVILCVPDKDSIWLECTSSTAEFDRLGTFTENRNALLITEDGGVLVATPRSQASTNVMTTRSVVNFAGDLSSETETRIDAKGEYAELFSGLVKTPRDEQKKTLVSYLGYKQPDDFSMTALSEAHGHQTQMKMSVRKLHEFNTGDQYFFNSRLQKIWPVRVPAADNRKLDYYFHFPFIKTDTTVLKFPQGYTPDVLPSEKKLDNPYASFHSKAWYNEGEKAVYTTTTLVLKKHRIAAADYRQFKAFFDEVMQDDSQKLIMKKGQLVSPEKRGF